MVTFDWGKVIKVIEAGREIRELPPAVLAPDFVILPHRVPVPVQK